MLRAQRECSHSLVGWRSSGGDTRRVLLGASVGGTWCLDTESLFVSVVGPD
jgi:hypothetical protein